MMGTEGGTEIERGQMDVSPGLARGKEKREWGGFSVGRGALRAQGLRMSSAECAALCGTAGALPAS